MYAISKVKNYIVFDLINFYRKKKTEKKHYLV